MVNTSAYTGVLGEFTGGESGGESAAVVGVQDYHI